MSSTLEEEIQAAYECILKQSSSVGTMFNIPRGGGEVRLKAHEVRLKARVAPGDAHESSGWTFDDVMPPDTDHVPTQPTAFPAAPAAPEICCEEYYGTPCTHRGCNKPHRLPRRQTYTDGKSDA